METPTRAPEDAPPADDLPATGSIDLLDPLAQSLRTGIGVLIPTLGRLPLEQDRRGESRS